MVDDRSVQASRTFSTVSATGDDDDSDDVMPAPKQLGKKQRVGPTLEDSDDEDDGKPAAKPAAKKSRALHSLDSALVLLETPLDESGPPLPEGPVSPVPAMPPEAARADVPKYLALLVLEQKYITERGKKDKANRKKIPGE